MPNKLSQEEFLHRCYSEHGDKYDFSVSVYVTSQTKVAVRCPEHGIFHAIPATLMRGIGCSKCAWERNGLKHRTTQDEFINDSLEHHKELYSYKLVNYVTGRTKVDILCNRCNNVFKMTPEAHLAGQGCPTCSKTGYSPKRPGYLYIFDDGMGLTKVGISNSDPKLRCHDINRRAGKRLEVLKSYRFQEGSFPPSIEYKILKELRETYKTCRDKFNGSKECFYDINLAALLNRIESLISEQHSSQNQP